MMKRQARGVNLKRRRGAAHASSGNIKIQQLLLVLVGMTALVAILLVLVFVPFDGLDETSRKSGILRRKFHHKLIPDTDNVHNSIAQDVIDSLNCESLFPKPQNNDDPAGDDNDNDRRRRLQQQQEEEAVDDFMDDGLGEVDDDVMLDNNNMDDSVNALHLLCLVAGSKNLPSFINQQAFACPNILTTKRQALLDIWSSARSQMSLSLLKKTLEMAQESPTTILNHALHIWMPTMDTSLEFLVNVLNDPESSIQNLPLQSKDSLFVDVGSGLGVSTLIVALEYPKTNILSIEPASPSWLLQKFNLVCNLSPENRVQPILAGVGGNPNNNSNNKRGHYESMSKVLWRPSQTRLTRTWTMKNETSSDDLELIVRLRSLKSILAEYTADYLDDSIDNNFSQKVLHLDCEACEYNLVPSMSEKELASYTTIIGSTGVHWGYIPLDKLPSSARAKSTHERLCKHYDYARQCIECCAFPDMVVVKSDAKENKEELTVAQVAGDLCNGFNEFAEEKLLFHSNDDYGWMELSSQSELA